MPLVSMNELLADATAGHGHELLTGKLLWSYDLKEAGLRQPDMKEARKASEETTHFTLSACGGRVFARMGQNGLKPGRAEVGISFIVCLDLHAKDGKRELWHQASRWPTQFEGAPLAVEERVYVAQTTLAATNS